MEYLESLSKWRKNIRRIRTISLVTMSLSGINIFLFSLTGGTLFVGLFISLFVLIASLFLFFVTLVASKDTRYGQEEEKQEETPRETLLEGKTCQQWYELGLREEKGCALGAALGSFEKAFELNPDNIEVAEARIRVAGHFTHIEKYRKLVNPDE